MGVRRTLTAVACSLGLSLGGIVTLSAPAHAQPGLTVDFAYVLTNGDIVQGGTVTGEAPDTGILTDVDTDLSRGDTGTHTISGNLTGTTQHWLDVNHGVQPYQVNDEVDLATSFTEVDQQQQQNNQQVVVVQQSAQQKQSCDPLGQFWDPSLSACFPAGFIPR
ncbi:hypothetical protein [Streptomyces sp. GS7]|uniref:hypothetical protein n=1 Tax=Streptomyces sp. GS7 TaxID=2692234 RepID=UPI0013165499|nr:hypothetical protein [Streptomyces sp. GS7]QHC22858.1 hypothetical protein GR130_16885 [Streptomyces sp. GS7]